MEKREEESEIPMGLNMPSDLGMSEVSKKQGEVVTEANMSAEIAELTGK